MIKVLCEGLQWAIKQNSITRRYSLDSVVYQVPSSKLWYGRSALAMKKQLQNISIEEDPLYLPLSLWLPFICLCLARVVFM